jgi:hypothetical protein
MAMIRQSAQQMGTVDKSKDPEFHDPNFEKNERDPNIADRKARGYGVFYEKAWWNKPGYGELFIDAHGTKMWRYHWARIFKPPVDYDERNTRFMNKELEDETNAIKAELSNGSGGKRTRRSKRLRKTKRR